MEFHHSSLLGLKAELLRKKQEVENSKNFPSHVPSGPKTLKIKNEDLLNKGVAERNALDGKETLSEDLLEKSLKVLQAKAKLYERLIKNKGEDPGVNIGGILVNFHRKVDSLEEDEDDISEIKGDKSDDEGHWVDFVDCLGRTKRCLKEDLDEMKKRDGELKKGLYGDNPPPVPLQPPPSKVDAAKPDLMSSDMHREMLRQKWEEQEKELLGRRDVHYQDLLFDEARSHGVGYYAFSRDEEERQKQQKDLLNRRKETLEQQRNAKFMAEHKKQQMKQRLLAAKRRRRERLGLPLEEEGVSDEEEQLEESKEKLDEQKAEPEKKESNVRKLYPVREWDIGKEVEKRVLSQDEWVEIKRAERQSEFAPPTLFESARRSKYRKKDKKSPEPEKKRKENKSRRSGAEVPPPSSLTDERLPFKRAPSVESIASSIDEGLRYLRQQVEAKKSSKDKVDVDIM